MQRPGPLLAVFFLLLPIAVVMLACGNQTTASGACSASSTGANQNGVPESIALCPATADAKAFGGMVPFTATAIYNNEPPVAINPQAWGVCQNNAPTSAVLISDTGVAQCAPGASGVYSVFGSVSTECLATGEAIGPCGTGCFVTGYAQMTCP